MRKKSLLLGLIFLLFSLGIHAQVVVKYQQGFEASGEAYGYTVSTSAGAPQTVLHSSGNRALKISHTSTETILYLDTLDFTDNSSYQYAVLEFMNICNVSPTTCASPSSVAIIEFKRPDEATWTQLMGNSNYDVTWGGGSSDFADNSSFSTMSYGTWQGTSTDNTWWKKERFNVWSKMTNVSQTLRKLQVRFILKARTAGGTSSQGWYLDNITVKASPQALNIPVIAMTAWPDVSAYPHSRAARIQARITTPVMAGMSADSIYLTYRYGHDDSVRYLSMRSVAGAANTYRAYIPFEGYDTTVYYRLIARDATSNHNKSTYPIDDAAWAKFHFTRGYNDSAFLAASSPSNSTTYPFGNAGTSRYQFLYDSTTLAAAGYRPGAVTKLQYVATSAANNVSRSRYQIKMLNVDNNYTVPVSGTDGTFYLDNMKVVYDAALSLTQNANTIGKINLQDTFFYAGKSVVMQITTSNRSDPPSMGVATLPVPTGAKTIAIGYPASVGFDPFTSSSFNSGTAYNTRPNYLFKLIANMPLIHDAGVSGFVSPTATVPADAAVANNIQVWLKNYGVNVINNIRIYYKIDDSVSRYYNWSGTLAGFDSTQVTISTTQRIAAGHHYITAWVDDSLTSANIRYRDHEPLNDTVKTRFVSCAGAMSGTRTVGSPTADFATLEQFIYSVNQCGVNGPLHVKLAPGTYAPEIFLNIPGASHVNFVQFEPDSSSSGSHAVTFKSLIGTSNVTNYLVNLQSAKYVRFKDINFTSYSAAASSVTPTANTTQYAARLSISSTDIHFLNCKFEELTQGGTVANTSTNAHIYSGGADSVTVKGCSFARAEVGVNITGPAQDNLAKGAQVRDNSFTNQKKSAVLLRNQNAAVMDHNSVGAVTTNASYTIIAQHCYGATRITRNTVHSTTGAACLGATDLHGTATSYAVVANNMMVSADAGTSNMLTTALNIIRASYAKVVYNSVKLIAPSRDGIAAATLGGDTISNIYFYNNVITCFDTANFAFNYIPTQGYVNYIGNNIYYSRSGLLNKYDNMSCSRLSNWLIHCPADTLSQEVNPGFINSNILDLRTYSQFVKNHGTPIAEVANDINDTLRSTVSPCVGAFEFSSLPYDFEVVGMTEPFATYCGGTNASPLRVAIFNSGVNVYPGNGLTLNYKRGTLNSSTAVSGSVTVTDTIYGTDTIIFNTNRVVPIPTNGSGDTTYTFTFWLSSAIDPNPANDTSSFITSVSYAPAAPDSINITIPYGSAATIAATGGREMWYPEIFTSGRHHYSTVYWYEHPDSTNCFYRGDTLRTNILYADTNFYIRQQRDLPLIKITQVQTTRSGSGVTYPMPFFMGSSTNFAVQLTNVGDYPASLTGDTLLVIGTTSSLNNKTYVFPNNITIQPGASLVLQYARLTSVDSTTTLGFGSNVTPYASSDFAILYKTREGVKDAVAFNNITAQSVWTNANVSSSVWSGTGINLNGATSGSNVSAGAYRTAWPHNATASPSNFAQYWQTGDSVHSMSIGTTDDDLILFRDNGCLGDVNPVHVTMSNVPQIDIALDSLSLPTGCGLAVTDITVGITNYGVSASGIIPLHYTINGSVAGTDTIANLPAGSHVNFTFSTPADFYIANGDSTFNIKVWADAILGDNAHSNDTTSAIVRSYYTPGAPVLPASYTTNYATRVTMQPATALSDSLIWYNSAMTVLDTANVFTSDFLYTTDSFFVSAISIVPQDVHIGTLETLTSYTAFPAPYNITKKYAKEQYLFTASELRAAGHAAGTISSLSFYLDTLGGADDTVAYDVYKLAIGTTSASEFGNNSDWQTVNTVLEDSTFVLRRSHEGWQHHDLDVPFLWDGVSNIVVQVVHSLDNTVSTGSRSYYTAAASNTTLYRNDNNNASIESYTGAGTRSNRRPDILFGFADYGCEGPTSTVVVNVVNTPGLDAELSFTDMSNLNSCGNTPLKTVLANHGATTLTGYRIDYWLDDHHGVYTTATDSVARLSQDTILLTHMDYAPGVHTLRMAVTVTGDTVSLNDTITTTFNVRFCAGTYTIGATTATDTFDFPNFTTAITTLNTCGINGAVIFDVQSGTYNEQLTITDVDGASAAHTITFKSHTGNPNDVVLCNAPTQNANYVLNITSSDLTFRDMTITSRPAAGNYANVLTISSSSSIHLIGNIIRVKRNVNNPNASCVIIGDSVNYIYIDSCYIDSGYYSILASVENNGSSTGLYIRNDSLMNFYNQGIHARKFNETFISHNYIYAHGATRALTGVFVAEHTGAATIDRNCIVLYDTKSFGKRGIYISSVTGSNISRTSIANNMISIRSNGTSGVNPCGGIIIDSSSFANVYYNTVRVDVPGSSGRATRVFSAMSNSNNLYVLNNIFDNRNNGYVVHAASPANIKTINYNAYYNDTIGADAPRFGYWGVEDSTFHDFRASSGQDNNSYYIMPYYISDTDLHLALAQFCEMAQYNTSVPNDMDGDIRPQIPSPCIGADEPERQIHDLAMMDIYQPGLRSDLYPTDNVESDDLQVIVALYNNGSSTESNVYWYADVTGCTSCRSTNMSIQEILPGETIIDTTIIHMPIGVIDTQEVCAHFVFEGDSSRSNNVFCKYFFLDPAYNFATTAVYYNDTVTGWVDGSGTPIHGCRLSSMPVQVELTNRGRKAIPSSFLFNIGYEAHWANASATVTPLNLTHSEQRNLPADLAVNASTILTFNVPANVYPTGADKDLIAKLRTFVSHQYDQKPLNDTTNYVSFYSKYTPNMPVGTDLQIPFGTWDTIFATQTDNPRDASVVHRPIRWYRDSLEPAPFFTAPSYQPTTYWETPQYFTNDTYFLSCISSTGCTSYYNPVHVNLNPRVSIDASVEAIEEPYTKVMMDNDTVKVRIINYGTSPISNVPVTYQFWYSNSRSTPRVPLTLQQQVTEICPVTIPPLTTYIFKFDSLVVLPHSGYAEGDLNDYIVRAWTDLTNEQTRLNDTTRFYTGFHNMQYINYRTPILGHAEGLDITRVSFAGINNTISPTGHGYIDFASAPETPRYPVLKLTKGTTDTLIISATNSDDITDTSTSGFVTVYIDYNRDAFFNNLDSCEMIGCGVLKAGSTIKLPFAFPKEYNPMVMDHLFAGDRSRRPCLGYTRMRVILQQEATGPCLAATEPNFDFGCVHDYLLYVEDEPAGANAGLSRIVSPEEHIITEDTTTVKLMLRNSGKQPLMSPTIHYSFIDSLAIDPANRGSFQYNGSVAPGQGAVVSLPARHFRTGTTDLVAWVDAAGDTIHDNDTLRYNWHRFLVRELTFKDDFEPTTQDEWYSPQYYTDYSENVWQRGIPSKATIQVAYNVADSDTCALVTNLTDMIAYGQKGNMSIIYTPIFDIAQVRPDTISFFIQRAMADTLEYMQVQYFNYQSKWVNLKTSHDTCWYNSGYGFNGSSHGSYERVYFSAKALSSDFQQRLQFRFVFVARPGAAARDGLAIDDFKIGRAQRSIDVGVSAIIYPTEPRFGESIRPRVVITNYGYDTIKSVTLAYDVYGQHLPKVGTYYSQEGIAPNGGVAIYTFPDAFVVRADFPDTFQICAYTTVNTDIYWNNDSTCKDFYLNPLDNDMGMVTFLSPTDHIVAGDSIQVTTRLRNYGQTEVPSIDVTYVYNNAFTVTETVDFTRLLGRPLGSFEYYNYTFRQKCRASMGTMAISAHTSLPNDDYVYNDTISKTFQGLAAIMDLRATEIVLDSSSHQTRKVQLTIDNVGALGANNFEVGFWYDNDLTTLQVERFSHELPLPALHTGYHTFAIELPARAAEYQYITAYVHIGNDNDRSNDTTSTIVGHRMDLAAVKLQVQENRYDTCKVRIQVQNMGNRTYESTRSFRAVATVNGNTLTQTFSGRAIAPGELYTFTFNGTIPKNDSRSYEGTGVIKNMSIDANSANNQTSIIEVLNYFENGVPLADTSNAMRLDQNYPNPYRDLTHINFYIPSSGQVRFFVVDEMGRVVYQDKQSYNAGDNTIEYTGDNLSTGTYYYGIEKDGQRLMRKMVFKR